MITVLVLVMLLFLVLKGFFSGSEMAIVNSDKIKLHHRARQGDRGARLALRLFETPDVILGTTLVGTNVSTVVLTTVGTMVAIHFFGEHGDLLAFVVLTPLLLVLGEIVPKSVYQQKSDELASLIIYPLRWTSFLFYPIIFVFSRLARLGTRLVGAGRGDQTLFITREQLRSVLEMAERGSDVDSFDRRRIRRAIRFADTLVGQAMIPIAEVTAISRTKDTAHAISLVRKHGFNRLPVYEGNTSNVVGVVTLDTWDLLDRELVGRPLGDLIRPACYVSPLQTIDELLPVLRGRDDHMAVVVDEFGSAVGMITMEDILEEVVGEIDVGYDFEEYLPRPKRNFEKLEDDVFLMDARLPISEANDVLGTNLPISEAHTVGGLVLARLRRIPRQGESIVEEGYRLTVAEASERAVRKIRVEPAGTPE